MNVELRYNDGFVIRLLLFALVKVLPICVLLINLLVIVISMQILLE